MRYFRSILLLCLLVAVALFALAWPNQLGMNLNASNALTGMLANRQSIVDLCCTDSGALCAQPQESFVSFRGPRYEVARLFCAAAVGDNRIPEPGDQNCEAAAWATQRQFKSDNITEARAWAESAFRLCALPFTSVRLAQAITESSKTSTSMDADTLRNDTLRILQLPSVDEKSYAHFILSNLDMAQYDLATQLGQLAVAGYPNHDYLHYLYGIALEKSGFKSDAVREFCKAIELGGAYQPAILEHSNCAQLGTSP